jgi:hypothetical protein
MSVGQLPEWPVLAHRFTCGNTAKYLLLGQ